MGCVVTYQLCVNNSLTANPTLSVGRYITGLCASTRAYDARALFDTNGRDFDDSFEYMGTLIVRAEQSCSVKPNSNATFANKIANIQMNIE